MSELWGAWNAEKKDWHKMHWKRGVYVPQWVTRRETAEMLVNDLGQGWTVKKVGRDK